MLQRLGSISELNSSISKMKRSRSISIKKKKGVFMEEQEEHIVKIEAVHVQKDEVNEQDAVKLGSVLSTENKGNFEGRYLMIFMKKNLFYKEYLNKKFDPEVEIIALIHLCRRLKYEFYPEGQVVFKKGQECRGKIYLLFNGEAATYEEKSEKIYFPTMTTELQRLASSNEMILNSERNQNNESTPKNRSSRMDNSITTKDQSPEKGVRFSLSEYEKEKEAVSIDENSIKVFENRKTIWKEKIRIVKEGEFLGIELLSGNPQRPENLVAVKDTMFAVLSVADLEYMQRRYEKSINMIIRFLNLKFPSKYSTDEGFEAKIMNLVNIEEYPQGNYIVYDGLAGEYFYFLYDGICELQKKVKAKSLHKHLNIKFTETKNVGVSTIQNGAIFGEECVFHEGFGYHFNVKILTQTATVLAINRTAFKEAFQNEPVYEDLREFYTTKMLQNTQLVETKLQSFHKGEPILLENNMFFQYIAPNKEVEDKKKKKEKAVKPDIWGIKIRQPTREKTFEKKDESKLPSPERTKKPDPEHRDTQVTLEEYLTGRKRDSEPDFDHEVQAMSNFTKHWENDPLNPFLSENRHQSEKNMRIQSYRNEIIKIENKPIKLHDINKKIENITATDEYKRQLSSMLTIKTGKINFGTKEELHREQNNEKLYRTRSGFGTRRKDYLVSHNAWLEKSHSITKEMTKTKIDRYPELKTRGPANLEIDRMIIKRELADKKINFKEFLDLYRTTYNFNPNSVPRASTDSRGRFVYHSRVSSMDTMGSGALNSKRTSPDRYQTTQVNLRTRASAPKITINSNNTGAGPTEGATSVNMSVMSTEVREGDYPKPVPPLKVIMQY